LSTDVSEVRTASIIRDETSVDNHFTRQYNPEDSSEHHTRRRENLKSHKLMEPESSSQEQRLPIDTDESQLESVIATFQEQKCLPVDTDQSQLDSLCHYNVSFKPLRSCMHDFVGQNFEAEERGNECEKVKGK
jgi:hypothetical protein